MYAGGSGLYLTAHVKLMVLPLSTCKSGDPNMAAVGTVEWINEILNCIISLLFIAQTKISSLSVNVIIGSMLSIL